MIVPIEFGDDLLGRIEAAAKGEGVSMREFITSALEMRLSATQPAPPRRFAQKAFAFGAHVESPWTLLAEIEGEAYGASPRK